MSCKPSQVSSPLDKGSDSQRSRAVNVPPGGYGGECHRTTPTGNTGAVIVLYKYIPSLGIHRGSLLQGLNANRIHGTVFGAMLLDRECASAASSVNSERFLKQYPEIPQPVPWPLFRSHVQYRME
jgi:hypothetical protein